MNVIGLKKCPKCGYKELYGCHNYYTIGAPFFCLKCNNIMNYAPYKECDNYISDKEYNKIMDYLEEHLETLDFEFKEKKNGIFRLIWKGLK